MINIIIIALKYLLPVGIIFFPFAAGWSNFVLDTIDGDILIPGGLADSSYQIIDKVADWFTYVGMVIAAYRMRWYIKKWVLGLFIFRSIGQILFLVTRDERMFFYFPNFLEPLFLIYATIGFVQWLKNKSKSHDKTMAIFTKYRVPIIIFIILYKMQDEYITHVGNIDRSDLLQRLF
jgi:hypothetical protein